MEAYYHLSTIIISIYLQYDGHFLSTKHDFYTVIHNLAKIPTKISKDKWAILAAPKLAN